MVKVALPPSYPYLPIAQHKRLDPPARTYKFELDPFQQVATSCIERNESVLVSAHTSAGKTVVAEFAIATCLKEGRRVVYTSPIKVRLASTMVAGTDGIAAGAFEPKISRVLGDLHRCGIDDGRCDHKPDGILSGDDDGGEEKLILISSFAEYSRFSVRCCTEARRS